MLSVLFLCSANSIRSPMAEGLLRHRAPGVSVQSAGALGAGRLHPLVEQVLLEVGASLDGFVSREVSEVRGAVKVVITLSEEANLRFPTFPGAAQTLHWPMPDPTLAISGDRLAAFRTLRAQLETKILEFLREQGSQ